MRFWEAVRVGLGLTNKGVQPTGLALSKMESAGQ